MVESQPGSKNWRERFEPFAMKPVARTIFLVFSAVITASILIYMFASLDWEQVRILVTLIRWPWIVLSLLAYFFSLVLRSFRFQALLYSSFPAPWELLTITSLHNMFNYILPARSGELSYLFLTKDRFKMPFSEGLASLFASRVYDFLSTAIILLLALPFAWANFPAWALKTTLTFCLVVIGVCVLILMLVQKADSLDRFSPSQRLVERFWLLLRKTLTGLQEIQRQRKHFRVALLTIGIWACLYANLFFICRGLGYAVDFFQVVLVSLLMIPLSLAPVQGFANLGTHELAWVTILMIFGANYETSLYIAFGTHFLVMGIIVFYGLLSLVLLQLLSARL